jgi:hypothetical protein
MANLDCKDCSSSSSRGFLRAGFRVRIVDPNWEQQNGPCTA